jgi:hypothetical protein
VTSVGVVVPVSRDLDLDYRIFGLTLSDEKVGITPAELPVDAVILPWGGHSSWS